jgi:hypothetical protein
MSRDPGDPASFTTEQRAWLQIRRDDHDRTLKAISQLDEVLAAAAFGRQAAWYAAVLAALVDLDAVTTEEQKNADDHESLLSDIERTQPRLRHRVRGVRAQYRQLRERMASLRKELSANDDDIDVADVRARLAWLLTALRHQRARESDLVYEAYYEAFQRDIEDDLESP